MRSCILTNFFTIRPVRCINFANLFWHETQHITDSASVHHQEFMHCTLSNGIWHTAFEQDQDGTAVPSWSCSKALYKPVWRIPLLSVQWMNSWWWTEALSEICRVSCQNKLVKLVHLVGFIIKKKLCSFIGSNCNNWVALHGMKNVKFAYVIISSLQHNKHITYE